MSSQIEKIRKLNRQASDLCRKDGPRAFALAKKVGAMLAKCADAQPADEFECLKTQTYCLDMLSKPDEALPIGLKANQLAEQMGDTYLIGSIQNLLGRIYWHIDEFPTAMDYYLKALKLVQTEHHPDLEISLLNGLGMVHYGLENYAQSLEYFKTCLEKSNKDNLTGKADANNNIAYVLHLLGRDDEATQYATEALSQFGQLGSYVGKLHTLHTLGAVYFALGDNEKALSFLQEGLKLSRENNSQLLIITNVLEISRIQKAQGNLDEAEKQLLQALQTAETINSLTNISLIHERLAEIYKEKQDHKSALEHFEAFHASYKRIFNDKSDRRIKTLEILNQVESTRKQAELYRELAATDSLTNLVNRRHFLEIAENAIQQAKRDKSRLAMIMLDIDHFKNVNDLYGHKAGDEVISAVAASIKGSLRQGDVAGRYGGEEFVVLVSHATSDQCYRIAERIRRAVTQHPISLDHATVSVTISLGVVSVNPQQVPSLDEVINAADQAMYLAKQQGRDRVVVRTLNEQGLTPP